MKIIDYSDISANKLSGYHIQDDERIADWTPDFDNTPKWNDKDRSFRLNTAAIELGYLPRFMSPSMVKILILKTSIVTYLH